MSLAFGAELLCGVAGGHFGSVCMLVMSGCKRLASFQVKQFVLGRPWIQPAHGRSAHDVNRMKLAHYQIFAPLGAVSVKESDK
jgi:hypothetical protein